eukprot:XP_001700397.1 predicted protein [Chlamydomonas reinhardtii]
MLLLAGTLSLTSAGQIACTAQFFVAPNYGGEVGAISLSPVIAASASTIVPDIAALPGSRLQNWGDHIQSLRILCICVGGTGSCQDNFSQVKLYMYADPFWLGTRGADAETQSPPMMCCDDSKGLQHDWASNNVLRSPYLVKPGTLQIHGQAANPLTSSLTVTGASTGTTTSVGNSSVTQALQLYQPAPSRLVANAPASPSRDSHDRYRSAIHGQSALSQSSGPGTPTRQHATAHAPPLGSATSCPLPAHAAGTAPAGAPAAGGAAPAVSAVAGGESDLQLLKDQVMKLQKALESLSGPSPLIDSNAGGSGPAGGPARLDALLQAGVPPSPQQQQQQQIVSAQDAMLIAARAKLLDLFIRKAHQLLLESAPELLLPISMLGGTGSGNARDGMSPGASAARNSNAAASAAASPIPASRIMSAPPAPGGVGAAFADGARSGCGTESGGSDNTLLRNALAELQANTARPQSRGNMRAESSARPPSAPVAAPDPSLLRTISSLTTELGAAKARADAAQKRLDASEAGREELRKHLADALAAGKRPPSTAAGVQVSLGPDPSVAADLEVQRAAAEAAQLQHAMTPENRKAALDGNVTWGMVKQLREELRAVQAEAEAARALAARWEADATALHAEKLEAAGRLNRSQLDLEAERQRLAAEVAATVKQREELLADANAVKALGTLTQVKDQQQQLADLQDALAAREQRCGELQVALTAAQQACEAAEAKAEARDAAAVSSQGATAEREAVLARQLQELQVATFDAQTAMVTRLKTQFDELGSHCESVKAHNTELHKMAERLQRDAGVAAAEVRELRQQLEAASQQLAEERTARQRLADQVGALAQQREAADADAATYEAQHRGDCSRMEELQAALLLATQKLAGAERTINVQDERIALLQSRLRTLLDICAALGPPAQQLLPDWAADLSGAARVTSASPSRSAQANQPQQGGGSGMVVLLRPSSASPVGRVQEHATSPLPTYGNRANGAGVSGHTAGSGWTSGFTGSGSSGPSARPQSAWVQRNGSMGHGHGNALVPSSAAVAGGGSAAASALMRRVNSGSNAAGGNANLYGLQLLAEADALVGAAAAAAAATGGRPSYGSIAENESGHGPLSRPYSAAVTPSAYGGSGGWAATGARAARPGTAVSKRTVLLLSTSSASGGAALEEALALDDDWQPV